MPVIILNMEELVLKKKLHTTEKLRRTNFGELGRASINKKKETKGEKVPSSELGVA